MENKESCCENCIYWRNRFSWMESETHTAYAAECHRFPPSTNGHNSYFPKVRSTNWCGEHCGNQIERERTKR